MSVLWVRDNKSGILWLRAPRFLLDLVGVITEMVFSFSQRKIEIG